MQRKEKKKFVLDEPCQLADLVNAGVMIPLSVCEMENFMWSSWSKGIVWAITITCFWCGFHLTHASTEGRQLYWCVLPHLNHLSFVCIGQATNFFFLFLLVFLTLWILMSCTSHSAWVSQHRARQSSVCDEHLVFFFSCEGLCDYDTCSTTIKTVNDSKTCHLIRSQF